MKIFLYGLVLATLVSLTSCNLKPQSSSTPLSVESNTTQPLITGKVSNDRTYSGQDCVMYNNSLYWTESKGYTLSTDFTMVGTIKEMVDKVPVENFTSAKSSAGSKIYIKKEDENRIFVEGELEPGKPLLISFVRRSLQ